jgi:hypothetical protein
VFDCLCSSQFGEIVVLWPKICVIHHSSNVFGSKR